MDAERAARVASTVMERNEAKVEEAVEAALVAAEHGGATVHWSDCSRCDRPRDEHVGPLLRCPT